VGDALVAGPAVLKLREQLTGLHLGPDERQLPQARQIALLGQAAAGAGRFDDLWTLEPCYIRRSAAEEKADAKST
jgi:tRNA A37 threonylcarbamoyladenosine modification protein TsaB